MGSNWITVVLFINKRVANCFYYLTCISDPLSVINSLHLLCTTNTLDFLLLLLLSSPKLLHLFFPVISSQRHFTYSLISSVVFLPLPACSFYPGKSFSFHRCLPLLPPTHFRLLLGCATGNHP